MGLYGLNEGSNYGFKWVGQLWQSRLLIFWGEYTQKSAGLQGSNLSVHMIREVTGQSATHRFWSRRDYALAIIALEELMILCGLQHSSYK